MKSWPQAWPAAAVNVIFAASAASVALFCTAPAMPNGGCHSPDPRGDASMWPQRVRSLG